MVPPVMTSPSGVDGVRVGKPPHLVVEIVIYKFEFDPKNKKIKF